MNERKSVTLKIGWILIVILGGLLTLGGVGSLIVAYTGQDDPMMEVGFDRMAQLHPDLPQALRGRRATAASSVLSLGLLVAWIGAASFRRAEKWSWNALLVSLGLGCALSLLRVSFIGTTLGMATAGIALGILVLALLISYRDFHA